MNTPHYKCTSCGETKPAADFSKNRQNPHGLAYYCRICNARKQREWKHANPEKIKAWRTKFRDTIHE